MMRESNMETEDGLRSSPTMVSRSPQQRASGSTRSSLLRVAGETRHTRLSAPDISSVVLKAASPNRMLAFNLPNARKREVTEYLEQCALRAKVKLMVAHMREMALAEQTEEEKEEEKGGEEQTPTPNYETLLKSFADIEPPPLAQHWIDNITKILSPKLVYKHSAMIKLIISEIHQEYQTDLLQLSIYMKFAPIFEEQRTQFLVPLKSDIGGKTPNYNMFLACRRVIKNQLFLTHPLIRKILSSSKLAIPEVLVNMTNYRKRGWLHLDKLVSLIQSDMKRGEHQICKNWYPKLINMISVKNSLETVPRELWPRFVKCASTVVSVQITQLMQRSISHIIETLSDVNTFPQLSLDAYYAGNSIAMIPSEDEIFTSFHRIIDTISYMAQDMPAMEAWFAVPCPNKFISVKRSESFVRSSHEILEHNLYDIFTPVRDYLKALGEEFQGLSSEKQYLEIQTFLKERHTYEEMFENVSHIKTYSRKIKGMVYKEYFPVMRLSQTDVISFLTKISNGFMSQILQEITSQQINENKQICREFEIVAERTLHMPVKTKELVAMGSYIKYCRTTFMEKAESRILESVRLSLRLVDFAGLSEEQLRLNTSVVNWLKKIKPIFSEYSDLFENTKYELEERLQRATEKLNKDLEDVGPSLTSLSNMDDVTKIADYVQFIQKFLRNLEQFDSIVSWINNEEVLFKFPISTYPELDELKSIVHPFTKLIFTCNKWFRTYKIWMDGAFDELVLEKVEEQVTYFFQDLTATQKTYKTKCKQQATDNYLRRFKGVVDDPDVNNWPAPLKLSSQTLNHINEFKRHLRLIGIVCNSALRERHWRDLSAVAGFDVTPDAGTTLRKFIAYHLEHLLDTFEVVSVSACKELRLHQTLCDMKAEWTDICFTSTLLDDKTVVLCDVEDVLTLVDNHSIKCVSIRGSAFVRPLIEEVKDWCDKLERINLTIETWLKVEKQWLDFRPIFTCESIRGQMDAEVILYQEVNQLYCGLMKEVGLGMPVVPVAGSPPLLSSLQHMLDILENINAGVKVYLNRLQLYFPRMFFLSDTELLEMIAETKSTDIIHLHLGKIFMGIHDLLYETDSSDVLGMKNADGEVIQFEHSLKTKLFGGSAEKLLSEVEKQMKSTMKVQCKKCLYAYKKEKFSEWVLNWPGQAIQCALSTVRTGQIHNCLSQDNSQQLRFTFNTIRNQRDTLFGLVQQKLDAKVRVVLEALIVLTVHVLDFMQLLLNNNIVSVSDFTWIVQLRYYQEESLQVKMLSASVPYGYEYLGNMSRLVVTPLTERCFRTLVGAYQLRLHGAPEGPPETGKTETVRDLARAVAVYCFSFCCVSSLKHTAIGKFLQGIAGCGAWGCLNDIHKVQLPVLSVVAQQLVSVTLAVRAQAGWFMLDGVNSPVNPHCYICVTLLPGLSVQSPIPDNLKILFRPVAMMFPDIRIIAEVCLYASGFNDSKNLALKLVSLQTLCSKQFSHQGRFCYDFGSLKAVLKSASGLKQSGHYTSEDGVLLQAIADTFNPKLTGENIRVLNSTLSELFPNSQVSFARSYSELNSQAIQICKENNLQSEDKFLLKITQIHDAMSVYTGVILVGEPFSGKTSGLNVVKSILKQSAEGSNDMEIISINPKTLSIHQMYGYADSKSNEWVDGIIPKFFREQKSRQWLRLDGPMDSDWLDILNTAFDTTHRLCLSSGEIIPISQEISVVFETLHLNEASPATVSRCGVVHLPLDTIGWRNLVRSWYSSPAEYHTGYSTNYTTLFGWIFPPTIEFVEKRGDIVMKAGRYNMVRTVLLLIEIMLRDACTDNEDYVKHLAVWIQPAILLAGVWGFGGSLAPDSREQFDAFFRDLWKGNIEGHPMPDTIEKLEINIPSEGQLNDYWYHFKGKGAWRFWPEVVRSLKIEEDMPNLQFTMVTTIESAKYLNILDMHIKNQKPLLLVGPTATGKTFYINKVMSKLPLDKYLPITILFSPKTSCCLFQEFVISRLERKTKKMYRASTDRSAVLFVDDMNLCAEDAVGAQPPVEVIHQYLDHGQWLRPKHNGLVAVRDLLVWAACSSPGGNRTTVCPRTLRHFSLFAVSPLGDETVSKIYSTLLFTGFKRNGFATDVMPTVLCIVAATGDMLQWACQTLRPTPTKPHYAFSLRDYAKIIHSHLLVKRENIDSKKVFIRLWVHEALRVFSDRLIDAEDRHQVIHRLRFAVKEYFKDSFDTSLDNLMPKGQEEIQEDNLRNLVFTTALTPENSEDMRYEEVGSLDQLLKALTLIIETYNSTQTQQINIVLFRFALEHLSRLCRVMSISGGCCMLLGMRGSGRQTIAQLATILCKASFFQPTIVHNYGFSEWRSDLKKVLIQAGGKNMKSVFFVSECELKNDLFLQDISMILSTGNVPDMFSFSETEEIFELVRLSAQGGNRNLDINPLTVFAFFVSRCRHNLHVVLSLSSISYSFRRWISLYPALLNYCTIDWVEPYKSMTFNGKEYKLKDWPEEALEKIAFHYWEGLEIPETIINSAVNLCKYIHITARDATEHFHSVSGRKCYVTSASYLTMVHKFKSLVLKKQEEIQNKKANFVCGLERLEYAASQVLVIQRELEALQPQLQVASAETERMMAVIDKETDTIEQASGYVREDEKIAKTQAAAANNLKTECEADLALAIPILEEAVAALNTLKPTDITLVKSMKNPPDTVKLVMAAVCVMKDIKPEKIPDPNTPGRKILDYWGPSKRLLGDMAFLQQLKDYDKDNILPPIMSMIRKQYLPNKDFKPHIVAKASSAAEGLCKWVIAMDMYDAVAKEVAPKKAKLEIAEREFAATMAILEEKRAQVRMLEEKLMELHAKLDAAQQRKQVLEGKVSFCENRLWKAQRLIEGLSEEKQRWIEATDSLQSCYNNLPGDILLCCGLIAYLAPLTAQFRENLMSDWCQICVGLKIPMSNGFSFTKVLGFDMSIHSWTIYGLPKDMFSIENAVILESTDRCPLLIDPQGHASNWIKAKEKVNGLQVIRLSDEDYLKTLEMSLTTGIPILVENVEEDLDSIILSPLFVVSGNTQDISGKKRNIFITTRLQNPIFTPVVFNNFSVVNFTLTLSGLEDKLLDIVVAKERPDLQEKKRALIVSSSQNKIKLQEVEVRILNTLQFTKGNILENESAIEVLDTAKALSADIKENQSKSIIIEDEIHSYCKQYSYVIGHTARLYFCLTSLVNMNYMYQFSLDWYLKTYTISIDTANKSQIMDIRLKYLEQRITYNLFSSVSCALFEKHRIIFALLLCTTIDLANKSIQEDDLEFLLSGKIKLEEEIPENSAQDWLPLDAWKEICHLKKLPAFSRFVDSFVVNHLEWKELQLQKSLCFPAPWDFKLSSFQKLIIIKIIYPDHMTEWILKYVEEQMGREYANPSSFNLNSCFEDSNCLTPLLLILSPGADPATALFQFARKKQFHNRFHSISLGVGQGESACRMVEGCRREGNWAVLLNCHLAPDYMASLERLCDSVTLLNTSMEFRLWLTCAPTTQLPMSILQSSVKMTTDLPSGLKTRLIHCYQSEPLYDDRFFYSCPGKDREFAKLLYSLSFFHSMLQERKKYRHIGWNVPYQFTEVDYHISLRQLQMYINQNKDIPYDMIQYVIGECNYGGRVYDFWDRRLLTSLVADLVSQRVADTPDCQLFPAPPDPRFQVPLRFEYHDFIVAIENIPDKCTAEVFGLNYNAEILHNLEVTQEIIEIISEMQPNNFKRNNSIKASTLDTVELIIKKLPQTKEIISGSDISNTGLGLVLQQEYKLYSTLLTVIHSSLLSFRAAFLGLGQAKADFEQFGAKIEDNLVPSSWINVSYDTCKSLGSYIDDFVRRLEYLKECSLTGYQQDVWLPGLFCPQALLVAVLHEHARLSSIPFHLLSFHHTVLADSDLHSADPGIVVNGLYIQGARWNHSLNSLEEQPPREFFSAMPRVWFRPSEGEVGKEGEARYRCPLYSTVHRLNFIADVSLPATRPSGSSHWVYRGVALLSQVE